jgi:two-component system, chemotaxis family, response regulator PixH
MARILCVDDESDVLAFLSAVLASAGHQVATASDAASAFESVRQQPPDLVITDVMMPGESGYSLCRKLREHGPTRTRPILVATILEGENEATEAGATAFLSKPLDREQLLRAVAEMLHQSDGQTLLAEGLEKLRAGDHAAAAQSFLGVIAVDPQHALASWARYYLGGMAQRAGDVKKAMELFREIVAQDPGFWRAHNSLAGLFQRAGAPTTARKHYERSLELRPDQPDVEKLLAELHT